MTFVPAVVPPAISSARARCFVVRQLALVVRNAAGAGSEPLELPELSDLPRLGLSAADAL